MYSNDHRHSMQTQLFESTWRSDAAGDQRKQSTSVQFLFS